MIKALLWIVSNDGRFFKGAISILERQHNGIEIVGVTANEEFSLYKDGKKVLFIPLAELNNFGGECDVLLVVGAKQIGMSRITQAARQLNLPEEKLLGDWIACIPGFTLEKYRQLQRSHLSIFSRNCFGSILSHTLSLPFNSPFKDLLMEERDFLQFLRHPRLYMEEDLEFKEKLFYRDGNHDYPVYKLGDISVHMLHYRNFDEAVIKWNERKKRINWYNLFIIMETQDTNILQKFNDLPYGKKACFVPFRSNLDSTWYVNPETQQEPVFTTLVLNYAWGKIFYYDPFDMLLYGKKTQLIDM